MVSEDQVAELARLFPGAQAAQEGGITYVLLPGLELPPNCKPCRVDALLCPSPRDGYESRLYFAEPITGGRGQNLHVNGVRILERNWHAFSWKTRQGLRLVQMLRAHLEGLKV